MDILKRELAPLTKEAWEEIDEQAEAVLRSNLSARKIVNVNGPKGWDYTVVPEGRLKIVDEKKEVKTGVYKAKPLVEARISFTLDRWEMDNVIRGAKDLELDALEEAVEKLALFEEDAIYNGYKQGEIEGLRESTENEVLNFGKDAKTILEMIAKGTILLKDAYVEKPYYLVVGDEAWKRLNRESENYPLLKQIEKLTGGKVLYSKAVKGALLLPYDHDDLEMTVGKDFSIGYESHDETCVKLFITESFTFRTLDPALVVAYDV